MQFKAIGRAFIGSLLLAIGTSAHSQTLLDYFDTSKSVAANNVICDFVSAADTQPRCFVVLNYTRKLIPENDPSGKLRKGATNPAQGVFDHVEIREVMIEVDQSLQARGVDPHSAPRMILAKLFWEGRAGNQLEKRVSYRDVAKGELALDGTNHLKFQLIEIPTQMGGFGLLFPQRPTAQIFGGDPNSELVKESLLQWTEQVLDSVLVPDLKGSQLAPRAKNQP